MILSCSHFFLGMPQTFRKKNEIAWVGLSDTPRSLRYQGLRDWLGAVLDDKNRHYLLSLIHIDFAKF